MNRRAFLRTVIGAIAGTAAAPLVPKWIPKRNAINEAFNSDLTLDAMDRAIEGFYSSGRALKPSVMFVPPKLAGTARAILGDHYPGKVIPTDFVAPDDWFVVTPPQAAPGVSVASTRSL